LAEELGVLTLWAAGGDVASVGAGVGGVAIVAVCGEELREAAADDGAEEG
jgi:hypothetical protein